MEVQHQGGVPAAFQLLVLQFLNFIFHNVQNTTMNTKEIPNFGQIMQQHCGEKDMFWRILNETYVTHAGIEDLATVANDIQKMNIENTQLQQKLDTFFRDKIKEHEAVLQKNVNEINAKIEQSVSKQERHLQNNFQGHEDALKDKISELEGKIDLLEDKHNAMLKEYFLEQEKALQKSFDSLIQSKLQELEQKMLDSIKDLNKTLTGNNQNNTEKPVYNANELRIYQEILPMNTEQRERSLRDAAYAGNASVVSVLLKAGTKVSAREADGGWSALQHASHKGHESVVRILLDAGADVKAETYKGWEETALHLAALTTNEDIVKLLLAHGASADVNRRDKNGDTPLHRAATSSSLPVVQALVSAGADSTLVDSEGYTPLQLARENDKSEIAKWLSSL